MDAPHHTPADSPLVKALLKCYEQYSGRKGECLAIGGGTYVHDIEGGVASARACRTSPPTCTGRTSA